MPVYIRKGPGIPEACDGGQSEDDDATFLRDPELLRDALPQPFRMIDKLLIGVIDRAWDAIADGEAVRRAKQAERAVPVLGPTAEFKLPVRTNCLACSEDGRYLYLGHAHGLSVTSTSCLTCECAWQEERVELTSVHCTCLGDSTHLLSTVDDMGVGRLFAHHAESVHLIKAINETEDLNQRHICVKFQLSRGGDFGAATMNFSGAVWLEVYRFPKDSWLKELEAVQGTDKKQAPHTTEAAEAKLSPITLLMKIRLPKLHPGTSLKSPLEVLQKTEEGTVIGSGQNHLISSRQWKAQDAVFQSVYRKYLSSDPGRTDESKDKSSQGTCHFLFPGGLFPNLGGVKPPTGVPVALCVWWAGSNNLLQYLLLKPPKEKADSEPKPDVLWPNAQEILCSAVSRSTRHIALGLTHQLISIWDRQTGVPRATLAVPADGALSGLSFMEQSPGWGQDPPLSQGPSAPKTQLLATCQGGACYLITTGPDSHITMLTERAVDPVTAAEPVPSLLNLVLLMLRSGRVCLQEVKGSAVCSLSLPESHLLGSPWDPVYLLEPSQHRLYVRGDQNSPPAAVMERGEAESSLFVFSFPDSSVLDPYRAAPKTAPEERGMTHLSSLEEACDLYFQERLHTLEERNKAMALTWNQLQQHAVTLLHTKQTQHRW